MNYTESSLVAETYMSPNHGGARTHKIDSVAIHSMGANLTLSQCANLMLKENGRTSVNYMIDADGNIGQVVSEKNRAYATSNANVDNRAISIVVANRTTYQPFEITSETYTALIDLLADVCYRNNFTLKWMNNRNYGISAGARVDGDVSKQNVFLHNWFSTTNHDCPGSYITVRIQQIVDDTNAGVQSLKTHQNQMNVQQPKQDSVTPSSAPAASSTVPTEATTSTGNPVELDPKKLNLYIITTDRTTPSIPYSTFTKSGVIGVMLEAGYLFTSQHVKTTFRNPNLYAQVEAAKKNNVEFGYYMYARAKTIAEVQAEMYELLFILDKYPPTLGIWLKLDLPGTVSQNDALIEEYQKLLFRLGMKHKMGFYVSRTKLEQITWSKHQDNWLLWIVDHISSLDQLSQLLTPEFFDMDGK